MTQVNSYSLIPASFDRGSEALLPLRNQEASASSPSFASVIKSTHSFQALSFLYSTTKPESALASSFKVCRNAGATPAATDYEKCLVRDRESSRENFANLLSNSSSHYRMLALLNLMLRNSIDNPAVNHLARQLLEAAIGPHDNAQQALKKIRQKMLYVHPDKTRHLVGWSKPGTIYSKRRLAQGPVEHGLEGAKLYLAILQKAKELYQHPLYAETLTTRSAARGGYLSLSDFGQDVALLCRFAQQSTMSILVRIRGLGATKSLSYLGLFVGLVLFPSWYLHLKSVEKSR